ncbi:hypothetical protein [Aquabacterium sp.]|uniref:hypothetical protein n=1 Tax=Aquabacterium sp. TaxID=1872578 RepID=UPI0025C58483|nr:hypothetical protein [Aquabacterium sp.]
MSLVLQPKAVLHFLLKVIGVLLVANLLTLVAKHGLGRGALFGLVPLFNFNDERNIPTLYSSVALLLAGGLLMLITHLSRQRGEPHRAWLGLALIFVFLSIDEMTGLHERATEPMRLLMHSSRGFLEGSLGLRAWVVPYAVLLMAFGLTYLRFLFRLPAQTRWHFMGSGLVYVTGTIGFEVIGSEWVLQHGEDNVPYALLYTCEETLEMLGIAWFVHALLTYLATAFAPLHLTMKKGSHP